MVGAHLRWWKMKSELIFLSVRKILHSLKESNFLLMPTATLLLSGGGERTTNFFQIDLILVLIEITCFELFGLIL